MMAGRVLGIDPGEKRTGVAISDETATLARPLTVIQSSSRKALSKEILQLAEEFDVVRIVVGQSLDEDGKPTYQGRRAARLAGELSTAGQLEVILWDESFSTRDAKESRLMMGTRRSQRRGHMDDAAASIILQSFLEASRKSDK